jgi:hypothetical protein
MRLFVLCHFGSKNERRGQAGERGRDEGGGQVTSVGGCQRRSMVSRFRFLGCLIHSSKLSRFRFLCAIPAWFPSSTKVPLQLRHGSFVSIAASPWQLRFRCFGLSVHRRPIPAREFQLSWAFPLQLGFLVAVCCCRLRRCCCRCWCCRCLGCWFWVVGFGIVFPS